MPEVNVSVAVTAAYHNHIADTRHILRRERTSDVELYPAVQTSEMAFRRRGTTGGAGPIRGELSIIEAANDPLIAMLNRADGVDERSFAQLLESASRVLMAKPNQSRRGPYAPLIHVQTKLQQR